MIKIAIRFIKGHLNYITIKFEWYINVMWKCCEDSRKVLTVMHFQEILLYFLTVICSKNVTFIAKVLLHWVYLSLKVINEPINVRSITIMIICFYIDISFFYYSLQKKSIVDRTKKDRCQCITWKVECDIHDIQTFWLYFDKNSLILHLQLTM